MPASRFHDGQRGVTHTVLIVLFGRELRIVDDANVTLAVWKIADVRAAPEIDPDGAIAVNAQGQPGVLLVDDKAALEMLRHAGIKLPGRQAWSRRGWIGVGAGLATTLALGVLCVTVLPRWIADAIPFAWEQRLGEPAEAMMSASVSRCEDKAGHAALERLVERLRAAGGIAMPVTISVLDDKTVNAFTLPGGHVLVMRGLIDAATDGPMLAGVISHELGHVAHRDTTTLMLRGMGFSILLNMIGFGSPGSAAATATNLMNLAYTRAVEAAADESAIDFLTKAGLRADGLSRFFAQMEQHEGTAEEHGSKNRSAAMLSWFATHPSSGSRRELTARPETGDMPFTDAEWQAIKSMCTRK